MFADKPQLLSLPLELLNNIWQILDLKSQKSFRLTSQFCNKLSTPLLFETFSVYPHIRSFERLLHVSAAEHIAKHVKRIQYITLYLGLTDLVMRRLQSVYSASITEEAKKAAIEHIQLLQRQNVYVDVPLDDLAQMSYFEQAFSLLPNLQSVQVKDAVGHTYGPEYMGYEVLPHFYAQIVDETCGQFEHTRLEYGTYSSSRCRAPYSRSMLMALHKVKRPIESLELLGVKWSPLLQSGALSKHDTLFRHAFAGLKSLTLVAGADVNFPGGQAMSNLQSLLKTMTSLESLKISFRFQDVVDLNGPNMLDLDHDIECRSYFEVPEIHRQMYQAPARLTWSSNLRHLDLQGMICTTKEMKSILRHCSEGLKSLVLGRLVLMPEVKDEARACLVTLLKWIQRHLNLESVTFLGFLTNGGMQDWLVERTTDGSLYDKVETFILKGGSCPLDHVVVPSGYYDVHMKSHQEEVPEPLRAESYSGDDSWYMGYEDERAISDEEWDSDDSLEFEETYGFNFNMPFGWSDAENFTDDSD